MKNSLDRSLRERALKVIPGGIWGHMNANMLPENYPQFFAKGEGAHVWDVDGNEYVDFMCSWGPVILGHRHVEVEAAVASQSSRGDCMNGPAEALVELSELMVEMIPHADWAQFQKNGTDATTGAVTIARAGTGRRKMLVAKGAYHGAVPWCSPSLVGVTSEDRAHLIPYEYNDIESLNHAVEQAGSDIAGIIVSAFRHDFAIDQQLPTPEFARAVRAACDDADGALILDDVRAGFRLNIGGSWENLGVRPDLSAWSKSIANGYPLAAITGNDRFRKAAQSIFVTGSFWCGAQSMAAAVATLTILRRDNAVARMEQMGMLLREGLESLSRTYGVPIRQTGPAQMPMVLFDDDEGAAKGFAFCASALRAGVYFHPLHNMFLSAAHTPDDIARGLGAAEEGFKAVRSMKSAAA